MVFGTLLRFIIDVILDEILMESVTKMQACQTRHTFISLH